jgi:hypothetical protein
MKIHLVGDKLFHAYGQTLMMLTVGFHNFMSTPVKNTSKSKILVKKLMPLRDFSTFLGYRIIPFIPPLDLVENSGPPMDYQHYGTNIQI